MTLKDAALCSVIAIALPAGQMLFKLAALQHAQLSGSLPLRMVHNVPLWAAFAWYGVTALYWIYVLTRVPLSSAYAFSMVGSGLVPLLAWSIFKEPISFQAWGGFAVILLGLTIVARAPSR